MKLSKKELLDVRALDRRSRAAAALRLAIVNLFCNFTLEKGLFEQRQKKERAVSAQRAWSVLETSEGVRWGEGGRRPRSR